jgi:hypothetical protein
MAQDDGEQEGAPQDPRGVVVAAAAARYVGAPRPAGRMPTPQGRARGERNLMACSTGRCVRRKVDATGTNAQTERKSCPRENAKNTRGGGKQEGEAGRSFYAFIAFLRGRSFFPDCP